MTFTQLKAAIMAHSMSQKETSVGKALGAKGAVFSGVLAGSVATPMMANAAITVPPELLAVFVDLATAFGTLVAAGAVLFGVIRGGIALFKIAGRVFSAAGA